MKLPPPFVTALRTLTVLRVPGSEAECRADALSWFPAVGALIGIILWVVQVLASAILPGTSPAIAAVVVVLAGVVVTRALHLDGLADCADAFWGGWTPERRLAIMKDSSLGTFGTLALILIVLAKWAAICVLIECAETAWILLACVLSRAVQVDLAVSLPYARPEGGMGAAFINQATGIHRRNALLTALAFTLVIGVFSLRPLLLAAVGLAAGRFFGYACKNRLGGLTGDTLGAASELTETLVLILAAGITP